MTPKIKKKKKILNRLQFVLGVVIAAVLFADIFLFSLYRATITPYAITQDNETICYLKNKESAEKAISEICREYAGKDLKISAMKTNIKIEKADRLSARNAVSDINEAVDKIRKKTKDNSSIIIAATRQGTESFVPDPVYKKNTDMLAGQSEIEKEGSDGKREYSTSYIIAGSKKILSRKTTGDILDKGTPAVIVKGTRGLPDGENWKNYEGDPVYKNGEDIAATAKTYIGKIPYVWGGKDLTKGVDCSGFIIALYRLYGVDLTYPLYKQGVEVSYENAMPGDILYFPGHYGMYVGDGMMVHASHKHANWHEDVRLDPVGNRKILCVTRIIPK